MLSFGGDPLTEIKVYNGLLGPPYVSLNSLGILGFVLHSVVQFNKALGAKQVWRIIQCPNSFMSWILKF